MSPLAESLVSGLSIVVSVVLSLKLAEMIAHALVIWRMPRSLVDRIGDAVISGRNLKQLLKAHRQLWDRTRWVFTRRVLQLPSFFRRPAKLFFRWPSLMTAQALLLLAGRQHTITEVGCAVLIVSVWVELAQRLVFRLRLGYLDTHIRRIATESLDAEPHRAFSPPHGLDLVGDFVFLFGRLVAVVILGYAAVYSVMQLTLSPGAFAGELGVRWEAVLSLVYFSISTVATVGYGDILPRTDAARCLVASEIMAGMVLLVLLITAFAFTAALPRDQDGNRSRNLPTDDKPPQEMQLEACQYDL